MRTRKRIMMISTHGYVAAQPELGKPDTGGQVVYVLELSKCLARLGYHVDILTRQFEGQPAQDKVAARCRVLRFPCGGDDFIPKETLHEHMPEWVQHARRFIRGKRLKYDAIVSHYWDAGVAGQLLADSLKTTHVHTPHSIGAWKRDNMDGPADELEEKYNFRTRIREERRIYHECDGVIATTPVQRDLLTGAEYEVPEEDLYVIPPGYDDNRFFPVAHATREALRRERGFDGPVVLALGRLARNKGYDLLIRAMAVVAPRMPEARLVLAAGTRDLPPNEQALRDECEQIVDELGLREQVIFHDYITDEQLPDFYRLASVFALSSRYEPFGMTAVEAMACGTPTVITTEGGLWRQVRWGLESIYANPFDPNAFGHMICNVLQQPKVAAQLSRYGSHKARADFTWMGIAQQIVSVLEGFRLTSARRRQEDLAAEAS